MEPFEKDELLPQEEPPKDGESPRRQFPKIQTRFSLTLMFFGFLFFLIGLKPGLFGLDRGESIGLVQILTILIGLGILTWGAALTLSAFWSSGEKTLLADFGSRVVATGYVICVFTSLADAFGFGTNPLPHYFLGTLQSRGLMIGMLFIGIGLLMLVRYQRQ